MKAAPPGGAEPEAAAWAAEPAGPRNRLFFRIGDRLFRLRPSVVLGLLVVAMALVAAAPFLAEVSGDLRIQIAPQQLGRLLVLASHSAAPGGAGEAGGEAGEAEGPATAPLVAAAADPAAGVLSRLREGTPQTLAGVATGRLARDLQAAQKVLAGADLGHWTLTRRGRGWTCVQVPYRQVEGDFSVVVGVVDLRLIEEDGVWRAENVRLSVGEGLQ